MDIIKIEEIIGYLETNGLNVIPIEYFNIDHQPISLDGDIDSFIKAVKALNETTVFICEHLFDETDLHFRLNSNSYLYSDYENNIDEEEEDEDYIDGYLYLPRIVPQLEEYKKYFGKIPSFSVYVFFKNQALKFYQSSKWFDDFIDLYEHAKDLLKDKEFELRRNEEADSAAYEAESKERNEQLIKKLKSLLKNKTFIMLDTQRAMKSYALKAYPELIELKPRVLRDEIAALSDHIKTNLLIKMTEKA